MSTPVTSTPALGAGGSPLVNQAFVPASVRDGSPATQKAYAAALGFEQMLVQQLAESMTASSSSEGGEAPGGEGSSAGFSAGVNGELSSLLPQALTEGVMSHGGLGLAQQLVSKLDPASAAGAQAARSVPSSGGVAS